MRKALILLVLGAIAGTAAGCRNTVKGAGEDIKKDAEWVEHRF
jgi:predicted small secreted protein